MRNNKCWKWNLCYFFFFLLFFLIKSFFQLNYTSVTFLFCSLMLQMCLLNSFKKKTYFLSQKKVKFLNFIFIKQNKSCCCVLISHLKRLWSFCKPFTQTKIHTQTNRCTKILEEEAENCAASNQFICLF